MSAPGIVRPFVALALLLLGSCGSSGANEPTPPAPSGELGVVRVDEARAAVEGLCAIVADAADDLDAARDIFFDVSHAELHVIASATEVADRAAAAELLLAKQQVESDLAGTSLPRGFVEHLDRLVDATLAALRAIDIRLPGCDA